MRLTVLGREAYAYTGGRDFDPALPCVVFVHGALHDHSGWTLLARWFAHHGHSVLAVDLPGHGRSAGPALSQLEDIADWLLALLGSAGVARAAWVGHSMGSLAVLEAAARAPESATQLVMIATAYPMKVSESLLATAAEQPRLAIDRVNAFSISSHASKPSHPGPGSWLHGGNRALMRREQERALREHGINLFVNDFSVCDRYAGGLQAAARVRCPTTFILGERDQMTLPRAAAELAAALKPKVVTLPAGHLLMAEAPDAVLGALRAAIG